jgi:predicted metal-dependent hydrolase
MREEMSVTVRDTAITFLWERKRVKRINLRVRRDGSLYVSTPLGTPPSVALDFVRANADFIARARASLAALPPPPPPLGEGSRVYYLGDAYRLSIVKGPASLTFAEGVARLSLPRGGDVTRAYFSCLSACFLPVIESVCLALEARFPHLAGRRREIRLRSMKSMWGNCRPREGRLTFSLMLAEMPRELIEGVVAHEYTHFLVPSHGERFYRALAEISPDHRALAKALTQKKQEFLQGH